jgi:hypothetical protein
MIAMVVARRCLEFIVEGLLPVHASGWTGDHAHALAGAERRLRDAQRPLTHHRPLYFCGFNWSAQHMLGFGEPPASACQIGTNRK